MCGLGHVSERVSDRMWRLSYDEELVLPEFGVWFIIFGVTGTHV